MYGVFLLCEATVKALTDRSRLVPVAENFFGEFGAQVQANGYPCFPIPYGKKETHWKGHQRFGHVKPTDAKVDGWLVRYPQYGIAMACGHFVVAIDIDELDEAQAEALQKLAFAQLGPTPLIRIGQPPKRLLVYRVDPGTIALTRVESAKSKSSASVAISSVSIFTQRPSSRMSGRERHLPRWPSTPCPLLHPP
jgi:hypothetical protein